VNIARIDLFQVYFVSGTYEVVMHSGLWAVGYGLWAMGYGLWAMGYGLWAPNY
jgi:hypothetical protein